MTHPDPTAALVAALEEATRQAIEYADEYAKAEAREADRARDRGVDIPHPDRAAPMRGCKVALHMRDMIGEIFDAALVPRAQSPAPPQEGELCKRTLEKAAGIFDEEAERHAVAALWIGPNRERWEGVPPEGADAQPMNGPAVAYLAAIGRAAAIRALAEG